MTNHNKLIIISIISVVIIALITATTIKLMKNNNNNISTHPDNTSTYIPIDESVFENFIEFADNSPLFENRPERSIKYTPITNEFSEPFFTDKIFKDEKTEKELCYRLFIPENYNESKKYPVLLFMHGMGGIGTNYVGATYSLSFVFNNNADIVKNAIIVAPQAPDAEGYWPIDDGLKKECGWGAIAMRLLLEIENTYSCDPNRIYITGNSMGGHGTWNLLETYSDHFAAGVPICGWGNPLNAGKLKDIPIWIYHGEKDPTVPAVSSQLMYKSIKAIGGTKVHYTELPGVAHDSWPTAYENRELISWMFSQNKTANPSSSYEMIPFLTVRDKLGNIIISEKDTTQISFTTVNSQDCLELTLSEDGSKKLKTAYEQSNNQTFSVYYGNKAIMAFTATNGNINNKFYIVGSFDSLTYYEYIERINSYNN